jgi:hypothetical protein
MVVILYIFAAFEFVGGIVVFAGSTGDQILGALLVGFSIMTVGLAGILAEVASSRKLLERQVEWSRKLLETQVVQSEKLLEEQRLRVSAQVDTPATTYRGYSYLVGENGVVLKLKDGGLRHFSSEGEVVAYIDAITGG